MGSPEQKLYEFLESLLKEVEARFGTGNVAHVRDKLHEAFPDRDGPHDTAPMQEAVE